MVAAVRERLDEAAPDHTVLVVDDSSPDGTGDAGGPARAADPRVAASCTGPRKQGLGQAYIAGFGRRSTAGARLMVEMDADFSHDPAYLPAMLAAAEEADLVLGSRYVAGGGVRNWGP